MFNSTKKQQIYLDYAATTPTDPRVVEAMLPHFTQNYGNPFSVHRVGRAADRALKVARKTIADVLDCRPDEIIFTGCGSESDNLALRGFALNAIRQGKRPHLITSMIEHHAVSHTALQIGESLPAPLTTITMMQPDEYGRITPETLRATLNNAPAGQPTLVSVMLGNNEVGTINPVAELAQIAHEHGAIFHTDAVQAAGQLPLDVQALGVDMLALTGHKFYGPKGVGLLYVRDGVDLMPSQSGGGQERELRAGTHNLPLIVGMATALELCADDPQTVSPTYARLRDRLIAGVLETVPGARLTGHPTERLPNHASFVIEGIDANALLMHLDMAGIAAGSGSACNTGNPAPSEVLLAMGIPPELALGSLRLTIGRATTDAEIDYTLQMLPNAIEKLRRVSMAQTY
jgi:cysteine desulfurase